MTYNQFISNASQGIVTDMKAEQFEKSAQTYRHCADGLYQDLEGKWEWCMVPPYLVDFEDIKADIILPAAPTNGFHIALNKVEWEPEETWEGMYKRMFGHIMANKIDAILNRPNTTLQEKKNLLLDYMTKEIDNAQL